MRKPARRVTAMGGEFKSCGLSYRRLDFHIRIWLTQAQHLFRFAVASIGSAFSSRDGGLFYHDGSELRFNPVLGQLLLQTRFSYPMPEIVSRPPHLIKEISMAIAM